MLLPFRTLPLFLDQREQLLHIAISYLSVRLIQVGQYPLDLGEYDIDMTAVTGAP